MIVERVKAGMKRARAWYFAYTSNMHCRQIKLKRGCSALCYEGWWLDSIVRSFSSLRRSRVDQSGRAYIVSDGSGVVWESVNNSSYWFNASGALPQKADP
jgi:hypothetical protein